MHAYRTYIQFNTLFIPGMDGTKDTDFLVFDGKSYRWVGSYTELQNYIAEDLKMAGIWKSLGGGVKCFIAGQDSEFVLKWQK